MDLHLDGKNAIVTGGSRGIGKAVAQALAAEGCGVAICARAEGPLVATAELIAKETGSRVVPIAADMSSESSLKQFVHESARLLGGVDILINNAASPGGSVGDLETISDKDLLYDFEVKVLGYLRTAREAAPYMKQAGWGRIINISGSSGRAPRNTGISAGVRSAAVVNLTKALANTLGPFGINVNAVYPGATFTEATASRFSAQAEREGTSSEEIRKRQEEQSLIRHLVTAEDIANVIAFLCSPLAISITGEAIAVTGGSGAEVHY